MNTRYYNSPLNSKYSRFRCSYSLFTGRRVQLAALSRLFEGFLDDGPQFVIRVVVVVLYKIGLGTDKGTATPLYCYL